MELEIQHHLAWRAKPMLCITSRSSITGCWAQEDPRPVIQPPDHLCAAEAEADRKCEAGRTLPSRAWRSLRKSPCPRVSANERDDEDDDGAMDWKRAEEGAVRHLAVHALQGKHRIVLAGVLNEGVPSRLFGRFVLGDFDCNQEPYQTHHRHSHSKLDNAIKFGTQRLLPSATCPKVENSLSNLLSFRE